MQLEYKTLYPILLFLMECKKDVKKLDEGNLSEAVKNAIKSFLNETSSGGNAVKLSDIDLECETIKLYDAVGDIESFGNLDEKEKMQLIKLKASIMKELLDMMKEAKEIKKIREFEEIMFTILTDEQKEKVLKLFE